MIELAGKLTFRKADRNYELMFKTILMLDAFYIATAAVSDRLQPPGTYIFTFAANTLNVELVFPHYTGMLYLVRGIAPDSIAIAIAPKVDFFPRDRIGVSSLLNKLLISLTNPIFVDFFELYRPWLKTKFGGDANSWPEIFNFARVIRNVVSHHHGYLHFDNKKAPAVSWRSLTYSPSDEGKYVLGYIVDGKVPDMTTADLIILMLDFSDELDRLTCPIL